MSGQLALKSLPAKLNLVMPYAVAVVSASNITVDHVPGAISSVCYTFPRRHGTIVCEVTRSSYRRYSSDLPQGGLEIPCQLTFRGEEKIHYKVEDFTR